MKVVQKVLSHGLLITFFIAVFLIYFYRVQLFPQWFSGEPSAEAVSQDARVASTPAPVTAPAVAQDNAPAMTTAAAGFPATASATADTTVEDAPPGVQHEETLMQPSGMQPSDPVPRINPVDETAAAGIEPMADAERFRPLDDTPVADGSTAAADSTPAATDEPPVEDVQVPVDDQAAAAADVKEEVFRPLTTEDAVGVAGQPPEDAEAEAPEADAAVPDTAVAAQVDEPGAAAAENQSVEEQLAAARDLFWNQDADSAEKAYAGIVAAYPENADAWGELGNVYFKLGRWSDAAGAFFKAANLLIDQGQPERAANMLRVLYGLDSGKGGELEARLKESGALQDR